jgi:hypothetical protein
MPRTLITALLSGVVLLGGAPVRTQTQTSAYTFVQIASGFSPAMDVNDAGTVVGWWNGPAVSSDPNAISRGYLWTVDTGAVPMITDPANVNKFPYYTAVNAPDRSLRINDHGSVAGVACPQGCGIADWKAGLWSPSGGLVVLGSFDGNIQTSGAAGINGTTEIVGFSWGGGYNNFGPFIWSPGSGMQHLSGFNGVNGYATSVNESGLVVGTAGTGSRNVPFVWSAGGGQVLVPDLPGTATSLGYAINDAGVVVGRYTRTDQTHGVFRWSAAAGIEDLSAPSGLPELLDINNDGDIVATIGRVPYIYRDGAWTNVNTLLPSGTGFTVQYVTAINNEGWIVGAGTTAFPTELLQGFVLMPANRPPVALNGNLTTQQDTAAYGTLQAADPDGDGLTFSIVANGTKGTATITDTATGAFSYLPDLNMTGTDSFTFKVSDGILESEPATVTITIEAPPGCAADVSGLVTVSASTPRFNKKTGMYNQTITLRNADGALAGPISFVLDGLSSNVSLVNATGETSCTSPQGSPYVTVTPGADNVFSPRERLSINLQFNSSSGGAITYSSRVLAGGDAR